jgi:hypothetical protein
MNKEWRGLGKRLLALAVLVSALFVTQTASLTPVAYASCIGDCSSYCDAELQSCYEWCHGCPYYDGAFFQYNGQPTWGPVTCAGGLEVCMNNCGYAWHWCVNDCSDRCGY